MRGIGWQVGVPGAGEINSGHRRRRNFRQASMEACGGFRRQLSIRSRHHDASRKSGNQLDLKKSSAVKISIDLGRKQLMALDDRCKIDE